MYSKILIAESYTPNMLLTYKYSLLQ